MLLDGRVLIFGGTDRSEDLVTSAEVFDPAAGTVALVDLQLEARAGHTATVLTDGRVLITGGRDASGESSDLFQLWDPVGGRVERLPGIASRSGHHAQLQPDGTVLISGGGGAPEVFVPGAEIAVPAGAVEDARSVLFVGSSPANGDADAPIDGPIALRFSGPLSAQSAGPHTIRVTGPGGTVDVRVTFAEGGRLLFLRPTRPLAQETSYVVMMHGLLAADSAPLSAASFSFTTTGPAAKPPDLGDEVWTPRNGWRERGDRSPWQDLPPLKAKEGATALSGQVLKLNGTPLAGVELVMGGARARSDRTGRFLIRLGDVSTGRHVLEIRGAPASRPGRTYGFFETGVQVTAGTTTVLPFTIWMPAIDTAHAVTLSSPTTQEVVVTTPHIPGLELRLPPRTVIRDEDGNRVTQVSITPIPVDRPPFPLPLGVEVPIYFTVQPGGAYVAVYGAGGKARLHYPNYTSQPPGTRADFWHYDPDDRGWYVYGQGAVEPKGRQVIPDPGVGIYEFTGAMISTGGNYPGSQPTPGGVSGGDPVDLASGLFIMQKMDLLLRDVLPLAFTRTYRPGDSTSRAFGIGSTHAFDLNLWRPSLANYEDVALILPDGARIEYDRIDGGTGFVDLVLEHTSSPTAFYKSRITWNGNGFDLRLTDGTVFVFGDNNPLQSIRDRFGNTITLIRNGGQGGTISRILSPNGRWISFTYDGGSGRITQATDNIGRTVSYTYASNRLWKVTDAAGGVTEYTYDSSHRMLTIKDPRGITYLTNTYDSNGRVDTQTVADTGVFEFDYTLDGSGKVTLTDLTNPRGYVTRYAFNAAGYHASVTEALGTSLARTTTLTRATGSQQVTSMTDPLNRVTDYTYDSFGQVTSIVRLAGTGGAVTTTFSYEPAYRQLASVTDPLSHTTSFAYDYQGRLTAITDPLSHQTTFTHNTAGQPLTVSNALTHTTTFGYTGGDLTSVITPLGSLSTQFTDGAGRVTRLTDPLGRSTRLEYDAVDQTTKVTDALGGDTSFTYDGNGNLLALTDARSKTTTWTYENMDRVATRTDPLSRQESFTYDLNGNLATWTDRKGQVTTYSYDGLERQTFVGFDTTGSPPAYASTITTTYDAGDRATSIVDSGAGTIGRTYDLLDRLTQEVTPEGTIDYTYDAAGRRATMQVVGQTSVVYTYDNADRLTGITQGSASVSIAYDNADRRTSLTLPNGIVVEYSLDDDAQLTGLTYKLGGTTLGSLTYTSDPSGQRTAVGGTWARSNLPAALPSATYDDANQVATFGGTSFAYDDNGNLTCDGVRSYTWNARDQLTALTGPVNASFAYDAFGRRRLRTVGSDARQYLYDGLNPVQELASGTATANLLTGLGIDEYFTRTDAAGVQNLLTDALGSTTALTDGSGAVQTEYAYEPFGGTAASGASTGSPFGFTGREEDGSGLYFSRARYYDPRLQRFISEDPIGFAAGDVNLHAYVGNAPTNWTDPLGLFYYRPIGDPCQPGSGKNPPAWLAFLCRSDVQLAIDVIGMASGGRGGRPGRPRSPRPRGASSGAGGSSSSATSSSASAARPTSPNQMGQQIRRGQAPPGVQRADRGRLPGEKPHVHLEDGRAVYQDGSWKHGAGDVTGAIKDWLIRNGWTPPGGSE